MIGIFLGEQNSGKTLSMTYFAYTYFKRGYKIYSNYNLNFPHEKISKKLIVDYVKQKEQLDKSIFLIDEIYLFLDSRSFGNATSKILSYFLLQTSKRGVNLFGTAQYFNTVDKRFRENCNFMVFCSRVLKRNDNFYDLKTNDRIIIGDIYIKLAFMKKNLIEGIISKYNTKIFFLYAKPIYNLYNTKELLDIE